MPIIGYWERHYLASFFLYSNKQKGYGFWLVKIQIVLVDYQQPKRMLPAIMLMNNPASIGGTLPRGRLQKSILEEEDDGADLPASFRCGPELLARSCSTQQQLQSPLSLSSRSSGTSWNIGVPHGGNNHWPASGHQSPSLGLFTNNGALMQQQQHNMAADLLADCRLPESSLWKIMCNGYTTASAVVLKTYKGKKKEGNLMRKCVCVLDTHAVVESFRTNSFSFVFNQPFPFSIISNFYPSNRSNQRALFKKEVSFTLFEMQSGAIICYPELKRFFVFLCYCQWSKQRSLRFMLTAGYCTIWLSIKVFQIPVYLVFEYLWLCKNNILFLIPV